MPKTDIRASAQQQTLTWKLHSQALIAPAFTLVIFIGVLPSFFFLVRLPFESLYYLSFLRECNTKPAH